MLDNERSSLFSVKNNVLINLNGDVIYNGFTREDLVKTNLRNYVN